MQAYDFIMLAVLAAATFLGFRKGLAWQVASMAAIVASYLVAVRFRDMLAPRIDAQPPWNTFLAMLILYVATSFVIWLMFQFVRGIIDRTRLQGFDRQLGAIFGMAKGVLLCVIITLFAVTLLGDEQRRQIIGSRSGLYIARLLDQADAVMPEELHDFLHPYLHRMDGERLAPTEELQSDDFQRLEDWLESGQGGRRWRGDESPGAADSESNPAPRQDPPQTPHQADAGSRERRPGFYAPR